METSSTQGEEKRIRRRTRLIDRRFQLKHTMIIVLVGVVVSIILGFGLYNRSQKVIKLTNENTELIKMAMLETKLPPPDVGAPKESEWEDELVKEIGKIDQELSSIDSYVLYYLAGFVLVMALFLFFWGIFITHRVAGPIFIISRFLRQIADGQVPQTRPLRKGDELKSFFDTFSEMVAALKQRNLREAEILGKSAGEVRQHGSESLANTAQALESLASEKKAWEKSV